MKEEKTESISCRLDRDLKEEFMQYLDERSMSLSKWLRNRIIEELEANK